MILLVVPYIVTILATSTSARYNINHKSAASDAQIRFAIENKYDDTGPGSKRPEYAYKTYSSLGEAVVGYLDDPDTKLPDREKEMAIRILVKPYRDQIPNHLSLPLPPKPYVRQWNKYSIPQKTTFIDTKLGIVDFRDSHKDKWEELRSDKLNVAGQYRLEKVQAVKESPLNLAFFKRKPELHHLEDFNPNPQYSYSYGVHDKLTGDSKSAHESRDGGTVRGYYTFLDADGKRRTVHYTADDKNGFKAIVERSLNTDKQ